MPSQEYEERAEAAVDTTTKPLTLPVVELGPVTSTVIIIGND